MYQIRLDDAYLLALKADTNLVQSGEKQMLMFEGKSSQSGEGNLKPKRLCWWIDCQDGRQSFCFYI